MNDAPLDNRRVFWLLSPGPFPCRTFVYCHYVLWRETPHKEPRRPSGRVAPTVYRGSHAPFLGANYYPPSLPEMLLDTMDGIADRSVSTRMRQAA